jgi:curved DNA-binding protein CbpA
MGNDSSKQTIENQQLILQLQQQLMQQQHMQQQHMQQQQQHNQLPRRDTLPQSPHNMQPKLPVISPAELLQRAPHPTRGDFTQQQQQPQYEAPRPRSLLDILHDKALMAEIDKNPNTKRKFLERLLGEHRHVMTTQQVQRITNILDGLPPADNGYIHNSTPGSNLVGSNLSIYIQTHAAGFNEGTTRQDGAGKEIQRREQLDTIDALSRHYKTEAEREEAEFKQEEARRRREFLEKQRRRRTEYQAKLGDLEKHNIDAMRLFNLQGNYTLDELKAAYKKLAMKTHPDKPTGNAEQFQLITKCYLSLLEKYKARESDRPFNELKSGSQAYLEDQAKTRMKNKQYHGKSSQDSSVVDKDKFDLKLFNKIYEQNKLWDSNDDGYGDWFSSDATEEAPAELFGNKFNLNVFNSTFEDYKERLTAQSGAIQEYQEPRELVSYAGGYTDLDQESRRIEDFSKPSSITPTGAGGKTGGRDLGYTDLKTAYTSRGAFIDPNKVEYKTYKSVDELKRDRGNIRYDMTPDELRTYQMKLHKQNEEEARRQALIRDRDEQITNTYSKTHERMLGYHGTAPG